MGNAYAKLHESWVVAEADEVLLGRCDALDGLAEEVPRFYPAVAPMDVLMTLFASGFVVAALFVTIFCLPWLLAPNPISWKVLSVACFVGSALWVMVILGQIPRRVIREADALVLEFVLGRHVIPLSEVLELVVLGNGRQFRRLLKKWDVFPHGRKLRCFWGASSSQKSVCVVLTRRFLWSFVFALEDPARFLLENQRPLDLSAKYLTLFKAALRSGEALESERIASIPKGRCLRILEQRGRRVLVQLEGSDITGWISYISRRGIPLFTRERGGGGAVAGTIGASELSRASDVSVELGLLSAKHTGGIE